MAINPTLCTLNPITTLIDQVQTTSVYTGPSAAGTPVVLNALGVIDSSLVISGGGGGGGATAVAGELINSGALVNLYGIAGVLYAQNANATATGTAPSGQPYPTSAIGFVSNTVFAGSSVAVLFSGVFIYTDNSGEFSISDVGVTVYLSATTSGGVTKTAPSGTGQLRQDVGIVVGFTVPNFVHVNFSSAPAAGGVPPQIQFNNSGVLGGIPGSSADGNNGLLTIAPVGTGVGLSVVGDASNSSILTLTNNGAAFAGAQFGNSTSGGVNLLLQNINSDMITIDPILGVKVSRGSGTITVSSSEIVLYDTGIGSFFISLSGTELNTLALLPALTDSIIALTVAGDLHGSNIANFFAAKGSSSIPAFSLDTFGETSIAPSGMTVATGVAALRVTGDNKKDSIVNLFVNGAVTPAVLVDNYGETSITPSGMTVATGVAALTVTGDNKKDNIVNFCATGNNTVVLVDSYGETSITPSGMTVATGIAALTITGDNKNDNIQSWYANGTLSPSAFINSAGTLSASSGVAFNTKVIYVNYTAALTDHTIFCDPTTTGSPPPTGSPPFVDTLTLTLPTIGVISGQEYCIKNIALGNATVYISSSVHIDFSPLAVELTSGESTIVQWDSTTGQYWQVPAVTVGGGGTGSGTVLGGQTGQVAIYPAIGTTVSGASGVAIDTYGETSIAPLGMTVATGVAALTITGDNKKDSIVNLFVNGAVTPSVLVDNYGETSIAPSGMTVATGVAALTVTGDNKKDNIANFCATGNNTVVLVDNYGETSITPQGMTVATGVAALTVTGDNKKDNIQSWYANGTLSPSAFINSAGTLSASSGAAFTIKSVNVNYTALLTDHTIFCDPTTTGSPPIGSPPYVDSLIITLPTTGVVSGQEYCIKNTALGTAIVEVVATVNIDFSKLLTLTSGQSITIQWDGAQYWQVPAVPVIPVVTGSGTVNSGTAGQLVYYSTSGTTVSGNADITVLGGTLTLGINGSVAGNLLVDASNSIAGSITIAASAGDVGSLILQAYTASPPGVHQTTLVSGAISNWTMTLPTTGGTNLYALQTNGAGVTNWAPQSGLVTVAFSTTPNFNCALAGTSGSVAFDITLTNNISSSTITNFLPGQIITFIISQNAGGISSPPNGWNFVWPTNVFNADTVNTAPFSITVQSFIARVNGKLYPIGPATWN